ncbi:MAG TPA: hypothetical protein VF516_38215, partial [Kofleriaceae bacterium]
MGIWDKLKRAFGRGGRGGGGNDGPPSDPGTPAVASNARAGASAAAPAATSPARSAAEDLARYQASEILGLSMAEVRKRSLKIDPYRTPWIGRVDTIPP